MNSSSAWIRILRILLFPLAVVYGVVVKFRNYLYNRDIIKSSTFNFPVICIGNLTVGGTGKSPMVEYLLRTLLNKKYKVATLSRGYKRKTTGFALANDKTTAIDIGDEPMQFHTKFPEAYVAVGEERATAIPLLLFEKPDTDVIVLDDAMQHRQVNAGLTIMLTDYNNLFTKDYFLPTGDLRDTRKSYKRADMIVVTKCPPDMAIEESQQITVDIRPLSSQHLFFSYIKYGTPYHILNRSPRPLLQETSVLLVCGIAKPVQLTEYVKSQSAGTEVMYYRDHYIFWIDDLKKILGKFDNMESQDKIILVTEKDAVRLLKFHEHLVDLPVYVIPIETDFLFDRAVQFNRLVEDFINEFKN
ncbi:MAG: tetraacyldisaccharide 4'-kinase [Chitinophagaceae bacterium]|nr:tetraacyldisaccharide 4'-kinase [Chitinophagaceae bacterium]MCW5927983.1 tetraacyldisaccharide 4'-kinase [Chitinophagaceae bacterium]